MSLNNLPKWYRYAAIGLAFLVWMMFFDSNSFLVHNDLNEQINDLEASIEHLENEIARDEKILKELGENPEALEKLAREKYLFKKKNEDLFIIEYRED